RVAGAGLVRDVRSAVACGAWRALAGRRGTRRGAGQLLLAAAGAGGTRQLATAAALRAIHAPDRAAPVAGPGPECAVHVDSGRGRLHAQPQRADPDHDRTGPARPAA